MENGAVAAASGRVGPGVPLSLPLRSPGKMTYTTRCAGHRQGRVLLPLRRVEKRPLRRVPDETALTGVSRSPVSRLFSTGGSPIAVRVLVANADGNGCGTVLVRR